MIRTNFQRFLDFVTFPVRAVMPFRAGERGKWGLSSRASERFDFVAREVVGYTLDVGCGPHNRFIREYLNSNGLGIDVFQYEGLEEAQIFPDLTRFPFEDASFDSVTLIATLHHIPRSKRDDEMAEIHRVLRPGGNLIVTQAIPLAEVLVHKVTRAHAMVLGKSYDIDLLRDMHEEEEDHVKDTEIVERMARAGFRDIAKKHLLTQWGLNRLFVGWKH
ncbi:MAG: methyltransferase domain-containing protein [Actinomycetota bacterium]|jgi:SAM-dependent methyltransferase|nr:methyltransferase domain-containing protein [Actinomycetota bacterium]